MVMGRGSCRESPAFYLMTKATLFFIKSLGFIVTKPYLSMTFITIMYLIDI